MGKRRYKADIAGQRFGRLVANKPVGEDSNKTPFWECSCDCGNTCEVRFYSLIKGTTQSCGCLFREMLSRVHYKHGHANRRKGVSREYISYTGAKRRCKETDSPHWKYYGGRGIEFRFDSFEQFFKELGPKPTSEHSLDRINNDGHYEPGNVRWATDSEQVRNARHWYYDEVEKKKRGPRRDLTGQRFGRLVVLSFAGRGPNGHRHPLWNCSCDCGRDTIADGYALIGGKTRSCGCLQKEIASKRQDREKKQEGGGT